MTGRRVPVAAFLHDARAVGRTWPLRAAYEASKRAGSHAIVFHTLAHLATTSMPPPFLARAAPASVPPPVAARTIHAAAEVAAGKVTVFSKTADVDPGSPHAILHAPGEWPDLPWWQIDIRSAKRAGDVKWAWELGRHRHLVLLARAAFLQPEEPSWLRVLEDGLRSWLAQNAPERGLHWYSNLEIALRALAWIEILDLVGPALPARLRLDLRASLRHSARHLIADLPYTLSTMRNNHLLGDGLGLVALGKRLATPSTSVIGDRLFGGQLARHMRADGSMIEDSLSYHRFVLEMLERRVLEEPARPEVREAMVDSAQFLCRLGVLDGAVPQYGDWDEGRALVSTGDPSDLRGTTLLALSLAGTGAPVSWREQHDEVAWYAAPGEPVAPEAAEVDGHNIGGGIARASRGELTVWLKAGGGPSHQHADLCSVAIRHGGTWLIGDPGTGTYNGPIEERTYFRSSVAHSVLRLQGEDQLGPSRPFRWEHTAHGVVGPPLHFGDAVLMWGAHDAYCRLQPASRVVRTVLVDAKSVLVADWTALAADATPWALSLPLGPGVAWQDHALQTSDGAMFPLELPGEPVAQRGGVSPCFDGWWSSTYGSREPATRLELGGALQGGPVWWRLGSGPPVISRPASELRTHSHQLCVGDIGISVMSASAHVRLSVTSRHRSAENAFLHITTDWDKPPA